VLAKLLKIPGIKVTPSIIVRSGWIKYWCVAGVELDMIQVVDSESI